MSYQYKGYTIVAQFQHPIIWNVDEEGNRQNAIWEYDDTLECYLIWDEAGHYSHEDFEDQFFESLADAKLAIDKLLEAS